MVIEFLLGFAKLMKNIAVYCGSGAGTNPAYADGAKALAKAIATAGHGLVYGGGNVGLMAVVADEVLAHDQEVIGVIPYALHERELSHTGCTQLLMVDTMHERKALMMQHSDAFIAMPGGIGTLEELFEVLTWFQLGFHHKPVGLLNISGYYDQLIGFLNHAVSEAFIRDKFDDLLVVSTDPDELVAMLNSRSR